MPGHPESDDLTGARARWYQRSPWCFLPGFRNGHPLQVALAIPYYAFSLLWFIVFFGFLVSSPRDAAGAIALLAAFVIPMGLWVLRLRHQGESTIWDWLVPGFRSTTWWKAIVASLYYAFCGSGVAVGIGEGRWDYIAFGFGSVFAALLPLYGLRLLETTASRRPVSSGTPQAAPEGGLVVPAPRIQDDHLEVTSDPPEPLLTPRAHQRAAALVESSPLMSPTDRRELQRQITEGYPFPIAFPYRLLGGYVSSADKYREQLRLAENLLAFLASLSLALLDAHQRAQIHLDLEGKWRKGISPGDWREILIRCSQAFSAYPADSIERAITDLNVARERRGFGRTMAALIRAKNDFKHDRGPASEEEFVEAAAAADVDIDYAFATLGFLRRFPIREVRDVVPQRNGKVVLRCLRYTGDHPGFAQEDIESTTPLVRGDLYVTLADNQMTSLHPFLVTKQCPRCRSKETYFVDKWSKGSGSAFLKSFERGHIDESVEVAEGLSQWEMVASRSPAVGERPVVGKGNQE